MPSFCPPVGTLLAFHGLLDARFRRYFRVLRRLPASQGNGVVIQAVYVDDVPVTGTPEFAVLESDLRVDNFPYVVPPFALVVSI